MTLPLSRELVRGCLKDEPEDWLFQRAWSKSLTALDRREKARIAPITGHVAESVAQLVLQDELDYAIVWLLTGPGTRGVDMIVLCPRGEKALAVEVKGTLRPRHWPRVSGRALEQMTTAWLDKPDNPGMVEWGLSSEDLFGALVLVNFAEMEMRFSLTRDFSEWRAPSAPADLRDLSWL